MQWYEALKQQLFYIWKILNALYLTSFTVGTKEDVFFDFIILPDCWRVEWKTLKWRVLFHVEKKLLLWSLDEFVLLLEP